MVLGTRLSVCGDIEVEDDSLADEGGDLEAGDRGDLSVGVSGDNSDEADDGKMVCTLAWLEEEEEEAPHPRIHTPRSLLASRHLRTRTGGPNHMIIKKKIGEQVSVGFREQDWNVFINRLAPSSYITSS